MKITGITLLVAALAAMAAMTTPAAPQAPPPAPEGAPLLPLSIRSLREALEEGPEPARECAWKGLVEIDRTETRLLLEQALRQTDRQVRIAAARTLRRQGNPAVIPILERELLAGTWRVREDALRDFARVAGTDALPTLRRFLRSPRQPSPVRAAAADGLGMLRDDPLVEELLELLPEAPEVLRYHALLALGEIGAARAVEPLREHLDRVVLPHEQILTERALTLCGDADGFARIERLLLSPSPRYRRLARQTLMQRSRGGAVRAFRRSLPLGDRAAQTELILALTEAGDRGATPALRRMLEDDDSEVAATAAAALARFGDRSGYPLLLDRFRAEPWRYGDPVLNLLAGVEDRYVTILARQWFDNGGPAARFWAATLLVRFRQPEARRYLERETRRGDSPFRRRAAERLADAGEWSALPILIESLNEPCPGDRRDEFDRLLGAPAAEIDPLLELYLRSGTPLSKTNAAILFLRRSPEAAPFPTGASR